MSVKIETSRRLLEKLDFGRKDTLLLHSAPNPHNSGIDRFKRMATGNRIKTDRLKVTFLKSDSRVISVENFKIYCRVPKFLVDRIEKTKPPDKVFSYFGQYSATESSLPAKTSPTPDTSTADDVQKSTKRNYKSVHDKNLPSWLLDSITNHVMRQPTQLPSGNWVDQR